MTNDAYIVCTMSSNNNRSPNASRRRIRTLTRDNVGPFGNTPPPPEGSFAVPTGPFGFQVESILNHGNLDLSPPRPITQAARASEAHIRHVMERRRQEARELIGYTPELSRPQPAIIANGAGSAASMAAMQLEHADRQLLEAIANSRALLNQPIPTLPPERTSVPNSESQAELRRASKRRKLDDGTASTNKDTPKYVPVNYGYRGQVVPGNLNMKIRYCDGGTYEIGYGDEDFSPENILINDDSVYCTKGSRCNLILQHDGERPFTMTELTIKAPKEGYDSPVKEGMVFVGMDADEVMMRTAKHKVKYARRGRAPVVVSSTMYLPDGSTTTQTERSQVYGHRLQDNCALVPREFKERADGYKVTTTFSEDSDSDASSSDEDSTPMPPRRNMDGRVSALARESVSAREYRSPLRLSLNRQRFRVPPHVLREAEEAENSNEDDEEDNEDDDEDEDSLLSLRSREATLSHIEDPAYRRYVHGSESPEYEFIEEEEDDDDGSSSVSGDERREDGEVDDEARKNAENTEHATQGNAEAEPPVSGDTAGATQSTNNASMTGEPKMLAAHACFTFQPEKTRCRMVFDPPVSARFILLKLWCPDGAKMQNSRGHHRIGQFSRGNIDIQSVVVKGFCGSRVFQDIKLA